MHKAPNEDYTLPAQNIWKYVEEVLSYPELLNDKGFRGRDEVKHVTIIMLAVGRIHPEKGLDYLGANWEALDWEKRNQLTNRRNARVKAIFHEVIEAYKHDGYPAACRRAETASKYQVIFLSHSQTETEQCIKQMDEIGIAIGERNDFFLERIGDDLVFAYEDQIAYYIRRDEMF